MITPEHHYSHTRWGADRAVICATQPVPASFDHVYAEWVGASTWDDRAWIQAGIISDAAGRVVYVESNRPYVRRVLAPAPEGRCYTFAIVKDGRTYRVTINGRLVAGAAETVPDALLCATRERW